MSAVWTIDGISVITGAINVFGTVDITSSPDPGEYIEASDIEPSLRTLEKLSVGSDGTYGFEYQRISESGGYIVPLTISGNKLFHATSVTASGMAFRAVGRTVFRQAAAASQRLVESGEGRLVETGEERIVEDGT